MFKSTRTSSNQPRFAYSPSLTTWASAVSLTCLATLAGCNVLAGGLNIPDLDHSGNGGDGTNSGNPTPTESVEVRLVNLTNHAVDVELYVSANADDDSAEALFVDGNQRRNGVGLAGTGVLPPDGRDVITLECATTAVLGTSGGAFLDADSGEALGAGTPRILTAGQVFDCGAEITLVYRELESDAFTVQVGLQ